MFVKKGLGCGNLKHIVKNLANLASMSSIVNEYHPNVIITLT